MDILRKIESTNNIVIQRTVESFFVIFSLAS
jgi:hypothetical protein